MPTTKEILDQVFEIPEGGQMVLSYPTTRERENSRVALYNAIRKYRRESKEAYAPTEAEWDVTPWDDLMIRREGETKLVLIPGKNQHDVVISIEKV